MHPPERISVVLPVYNESENSTASRPRALATVRNACALIFGALLWLSRFTPPRLSNTLGLDDSWKDALAYFHARGFQAGVDYVFTYGPLGFLDVGQFRAEQFWTRIVVWEFGVELACVCVFVATFLRLNGTLPRVLFALASWIAATNSDTYLALVLILATLASLNCAGQRSRLVLAASLALTAVIALGKFHFFLLAAICVLVLAVAIFRRRGVGGALGVASVYSAFLLLAWVCVGQDLRNFPTYIARSMAMTRGYTEGMSYASPAEEIVVGAIVVGLFLIAAALAALDRGASWERRSGVALLALGSALSFKSSFVRGDCDMGSSFFACVAVLALWGGERAPAGNRSAWSSYLRYGFVLLAMFVPRALIPHPARAGMSAALWQMPSRWKKAVLQLTDLDEFKALQQRNAEFQRSMFDLPRVRAAIGSHALDYFGTNQTLILRTGFEYRPRPVFQPYAAYTPELTELNARHLQASAPPFVIMGLDPTDGHLMATEDALTFQAILRDYEPLLCERGLLLWRRKPVAELEREAPRSIVLERTVPLGRWIELPESDSGCRVATIEIERTWRGHLYASVWGAKPLMLEVRRRHKYVRSFRASPPMLRSGFLLDPLIGDHLGLVCWLTGIRPNRARAFRLVASEGAEQHFEARYRLRIEQADELDVQPPPDPEKRFGYAFSRDAPEEVLTPGERTSARLSNREVLMVSAPSETRLAVPAGKHVLSAWFGLHPQSFVYGATDGATFMVELAGQGRALFQRHLDPRGIPADKELQELRVAFETHKATELILRVHPGPLDDPTDDYACWTDIDLKSETR